VIQQTDTLHFPFTHFAYISTQKTTGFIHVDNEKHTQSLLTAHARRAGTCKFRVCSQLPKQILLESTCINQKHHWNSQHHRKENTEFHMKVHTTNIKHPPRFKLHQKISTNYYIFFQTMLIIIQQRPTGQEEPLDFPTSKLQLQASREP
jgi:hypothetical protein